MGVRACVHAYACACVCACVCVVVVVGWWWWWWLHTNQFIGHVLEPLIGQQGEVGEAACSRVGMAMAIVSDKAVRLFQHFERILEPNPSETVGKDGYRGFKTKRLRRSVVWFLRHGPVGLVSSMKSRNSAYSILPLGCMDGHAVAAVAAMAALAVMWG